MTFPREPLARFRLLALWFAMLVTIAGGVGVLFASREPRVLVASASAFLLAAWWAYGYRRGSFPVVGFLVEPVLLVVAATGVPLPMRRT